MAGRALIGAVKRNMQYIVGGSLGVLFGVSCVPQTLGLDSYRETLAQYKDEEDAVIPQEVPLSDDISKLTDKVLTHLLLPAREEAALEFFSAFGVDMVHIGSLKLRSGAYVGIPSNMDYKHVDEVQTEKIQMARHRIDWSSADGQKLRESLVLSNKAKAFAVAREINYVHTHHVVIDAFFKGMFGMFAYATGFILNRLLRLQARMKTWGRVGMYIMIGGLYVPLYVVAIDTYMCHRDNKVDRWTAQLGLAYAQGGVEYYNKLLHRNQALRTLLGPEGPVHFTVTGNEVATWRRPKETLTNRRDNLQDYVKQYDTKIDLGFDVN